MSAWLLGSPPTCSRWSNRIVLLSLLGIGYLTLFPFGFHAGAFRAIHGNPFLLGESGKESFTRDFFLNVLLFVPFGFGVATQVRKRNGGLLKAFLWALALGALVSYSVEFTQLYIPERDSGWLDVFSNTTGSAAGFLLFAALGGPLLEVATRVEDWVRMRFSLRIAAIALFVYFAMGFGVSAFLQSQTRLSNWDPRCVLFVGNDASGHASWAGQVFRLEIWSRALPERTIQHLAEGSGAEENAGPTAIYEFNGGRGPFPDQQSSSPALTWTADHAQSADTGPLELGGRSWLSTEGPAERVNLAIQANSQFTVRVVCKPALVDSGFGRIVSLSRSSEDVNFHLRQAGTHLVFYFRNPLSETRSILAWDLPGIFTDRKTRDITAVYDGSDAFLYVDGKPVPRKYKLGPGASLFHDLNFVRTPELQGCVVVYLTLLFLPAGVLLGLTAGNWLQNKRGTLLLSGACVLSAVLLDALLSAQSGRNIWASNIALALAFELAGVLLINSDGMRASALVTEVTQGEKSGVATES